MAAFCYERAAYQTAIAKLFGNRYASEQFGTPIPTLKGWSSRARRDEKLAAMIANEIEGIKARTCEPLALVHSAVASAISEIAPKLAARGCHQDGLALAQLYEAVGNHLIAIKFLAEG